MTRRPSGRALTVAAAGFLLLDAVLLALAGWWSRRPGLVVWAVVFALGAVGVVWLWRRYLARLAELDRARDALKAEARRLSQALKQTSS